VVEERDLLGCADDVPDAHVIDEALPVVPAHGPAAADAERLPIARAEAGQIHLTFAPVDLGELACSVIEDLESLADARSIRLGCEPKHGVVVKGDAGWLRRLLINLVDNALKFTPEGGRVTVRVTTHGETAAIDVEDTGIGLTREDAARVFERFFRADPSRTSRIEGAGLGLSLVQWVAAQHHGTVSVTSQPGAGTTFTVTLPRAT